MSPSRQDSPEVAARIGAGIALVPVVVGQMKKILAAYARVDDLTSFGNEGALAAGRTYDADLGVPFNRWATLRIRAAIIDGVRTQVDLPRRLYEQLRALEAANWVDEGMTLDDAGTPPPGSATAADACIADRLASMATAFAAGVLMDREEATLEAIVDKRETPEEEVAREELKSVLRAAIADRPDEERLLLQRYYFEGATMAEASGGLSKSWASRLHARAISGVAKAIRRASPPRDAR